MLSPVTFEPPTRRGGDGSDDTRRLLHINVPGSTDGSSAYRGNDGGVGETPGTSRQERISERRLSNSTAGAVERLAQQRAVLPLLAKDVAIERRRAIASEAENALLRRRVAELESQLAAAEARGGGEPPRTPAPARTDEG